MKGKQFSKKKKKNLICNLSFEFPFPLALADLGSSMLDQVSSPDLETKY